MIPYFQGLSFLSDSDYRGCYWWSQEWSKENNLLHPLITVFTELFIKTKKPNVSSCGRNCSSPSPTTPPAPLLIHFLLSLSLSPSLNFVTLEIKPKALCFLSKCSTSELHPSPALCFLSRSSLYYFFLSICFKFKF